MRSANILLSRIASSFADEAMSERNLIDKSQENDYTVTTVQPGEQRPPEPEIRYSRGDGTPRAFGSYCWPLQVAMRFGSCATGVCEPCQVGNKAALNRISRVPQGCLAELTVKVTDMGFGSKRAARSLKKRTVFREKPGRIWASGGREFLRAFFSYSSLVFHSREWNCIKTKRKRK